MVEANGWEVGWTSDVFEGRPHPDDGERREHLCYYVLLEEISTGLRWRSRWHVTTEERSTLACEALVAAHEERVRHGLSNGADPRRSERWASTYPSYCSRAYDGRAERAAEIDAAYVAGEISHDEVVRLTCH